MQTEREQHLHNMSSSSFLTYLKRISELREVPSTNTNKDKIILVSHLRLFTIEPTIRDFFSQYGEVTKLTFQYDREFDYTSGPVLNYTRTCLVEFATPDTVDLVLSQDITQPIRIDRYPVKVTRYIGKEAHQDLFIKGPYKLYLRKMPYKIPKENKKKHGRAKLRKLCGKLLSGGRVHYHFVRDCNVTNILEKLFKNLDYNRITIKKGDNDQFMGEATIRFMTYNGCKEAQEIAESRLNCKTKMKNKAT